MSSFDQDALTVLRVMREHAIIVGKAKKASKVASLAQLNQEDFESADNFLLNAGYVDGTGGGKEGWRWLTPLGIDYLRNAMADRLPLSLDAELVLRHAVKCAHHQEDFVTRADIMSALGLGSERFGAACQKLVDFDLISDESSMNDQEFAFIKPSQVGRQTVHMDFARPPTPTANIQAGAIFHAPVMGSNIQAIASAFDSQIKQVVIESDPDVLRQEIGRVLEQLTSTVTAKLTVEQMHVYSKAALDLKAGVGKAQPDASAIHRFLDMLGFAGDLDGTIELGKKGLELSVLAGPYILALGQAVLQLLSSLGR